MTGLGTLWAALAAAALAAPAAPVAPTPRAPATTFTPWTKTCSQGRFGAGCVLTSEARREDGSFVASAVVVEPGAGAKPLLRVGLPLGVLLFRGVTAAVDKDPAARGTFTVCVASGCLADIESYPDLEKKLAAGKTIDLEWTAADGSDASCVVPLDGFVDALHRP